MDNIPSPAQTKRTHRRIVLIATALLAATAVLFAACSSVVSSTPSPSSGTASTTNSTTPAPAQAAATAPSANDTVTAVEAVITKGNQEQAAALAANDPMLMQDTATPQYYAALVQTQQELQAQGAVAIQLVDIEWGQARINGASAQVDTTETWQTTFADGATEQDSAQNTYTLSQQSGSWLIASDAQVGDTSSGGSGASQTSTVALSQSSNWAGYSATGGPFTAVTGSWKVPQVSADSGPASADATWVGVGGVTSDDLIQAGTEATVSATGQVAYNAWVELLPQASQEATLAVHPGDLVSVSIVQQAIGTWLITITDEATTQSYQTTVQYSSSLSSVEWIEEAPSVVGGHTHVVTLDDFGTVSFDDASATVSGQSVTAAAANAQSINMFDRSGNIAATSAIGASGASFTVTRVGSAV